MEVDGDGQFFLQRLDQHGGGGGFQEARHVLEPEDMSARGLQLLGHRDIVFQVIFRPGGVEHVAGIADRRLADLVGVDDRVHGDAHVFDPVERVEDAEDVDAGLGRLRDKGLHDVVGVVGIAHRVRGAEQHLRHDVGHLFADVAQALPRAFLQEAIGHVKGRAAPAFDAEEVAHLFGIGGAALIMSIDRIRVASSD